MKKVLVVDLTNFYGGGQDFINTHLNDIEGIEFFYYVKSDQLCEKLKLSSKNAVENSFNVNLQNIKKIIKEKNIEIIVLNGGRSLFMAPFLFGKAKLIGIRHTLNSSVNRNYKILYLMLMNICFMFMNRVVHVSNKSKSEQWFCRRKAVVIHNGVKPKPNYEYKRKDNKTVFVSIGRTTKTKGTDILIDAFNELSSDRCELVLVGTGDIDSQYPHKSNILFEGFSTSLGKYFEMADYYISLPTTENCSMAILDSLSYGVPIISSKVGGNPELIDDTTNGFFVERNKNEIINFIKNKILSMSDLEYYQLRKNAVKKFNDNFDLLIAKNKYKNLMETI